VELLYAPWRENYIRSFADGKRKGCFICRALKEPDENAFVLYRGKSVIVLMNTFPYNYGHILVAPKRHVGNLEDLTNQEALEIFRIIRIYTRLFRECFKPDGFNIGLNVGSAAGAGLPDHLHVHVVPRWKGDSNFMAVISGTRIVSFDIKRAYAELKALFEEAARYLSQEEAQDESQQNDAQVLL